MGLWRILCVLIVLEKSWGQEQVYVISAPKVFIVGASENIVIQGSGYTEAFDIIVSVKSYPDKNISYSSDYVHLSEANRFQNSAVLTIQPKQLPGGQNSVSHVYLEVVSKYFSELKKIPITYNNGFLFIHTDKTVYSPRESVKVTVYSLNDDLMPARRPTVLTFIDPEGSEVDVVEENDYSGIISFPDFKILPNPKYGVWTIKAKYKEDFSTIGTTDFKIKEYVLPHFSISIRPESKVIGYKSFKNFKITIKARYSRNHVVPEAQVFVSFGIREDIQDDRKEMMPKAKQNVTLKNGTAHVTFNSEMAIKELSYNSLADLNDKYLYIAVTVVEVPGGFSEKAEVRGIRYILSLYTLNLLATPLFLKPEIPISIKVQVKGSLDQPVGGVPVTMNARTVNVSQETSDLPPKRVLTSFTNGVAPFLVSVPSGVTVLEFSVKTDAPHVPKANQASKHYQAIAYSSPSQSYLSIIWASNSQAVRLGEFLRIIFSVQSPYIHNITHYNYLILSKGKIVHFSTHTKNPYSPYEIMYIYLTPDMVPSARILIYYVIPGQQTAEIISDSVVFNIEEKCCNQLEVFQVFQKSDQGCGIGGGLNNADVFHRAGLRLITNANVDESQENDEPCKEILRRRRSLKEKIEEQAAKYKHAVLKKCCYDGAHRNDFESCEQRAARISIGPRCTQAFKECCLLASQIRGEETGKHRQLGGRH
ncbi:complement C5-like [Octodon degus]|uniref:Complement C5-like n=1 Tax=Octodon degus TaxID=10160 RepID=A0A6P6DB63_OCTDE|nr:complement C5-like [Octodon degus]